MSATHSNQFTADVAAIYMAIELSQGQWKLGFSPGLGQSPRLRTIRAGNYEKLLAEVHTAKARFKLAADAPVYSCYEAGRDGFHVHRCLISLGINNVIVDSASIEVNRRQRRAKTDRMDATKLVTMLIRWHIGERTVWRVVNVPSVENEDRRELHRELGALKEERTAHVNRIKGLLYSRGFRLRTVNHNLPEQLQAMANFETSPLPPNLHTRLLREHERWELLNTQINQIRMERVKRIRTEESPQVEQVRTLLELRGVGQNGAWVLVHEVFGWRQIKNRRQLGSLAGLTPTPYSSGDSNWEQGVSKAGNRRVRAMLIELAWSWLRYQPESELAKWYARRFALGNSRLRRIGIVALARKLLVALWKLLDAGEIPQGAETVTWQHKLKGARLEAAAV
jgi:transposase